MGLFIANCVHGFTCLVLLVLLIMAGLMAFDIRDPVTQAVDETWYELRPELEGAEFCTSVPDKQKHCAVYQAWAEIVTTETAALNGAITINEVPEACTVVASTAGTCAVTDAGTNVNCAAAMTDAACTTASTAGGVTAAENACVYTADETTAATTCTLTAAAAAVAADAAAATPAVAAVVGDCAVGTGLGDCTYTAFSAAYVQSVALTPRASAEPNLVAPCPWTSVEMAQNCTKALDCDTSNNGARHKVECAICDIECKNMLLDELRGNVAYIANFFHFVFWGLCVVLVFNIRMADICSDVDDWNEFMKQEAKKRGIEDYVEEEMHGTSIQKLGMIMNAFMLVAGLISSIMAAYILSSMSDLFSAAAWGILLVGLALTVTGGALFYGANTATTPILKAGNYLLALFTVLFLFFAILMSMTTGNISDLHKSVDDEWPKTEIKIKRDDPGYCTFSSASCTASDANNNCKMTSAECKDKYMGLVQTNITNMFTLAFLEMGFLVTLVLLTNHVVIAMYHGSGGNLKDKVRGMTNHKKRLPEAEKKRMMDQRRAPPKMMSKAQQEAAVLGGGEDPEDPNEIDPEDPDAKKLLLKGDNALHDGDMDDAVKL